MTNLLRSFVQAAVTLALAVPGVALAQNVAPSGAVVFENVRIFDGTSEELSGPSNVLVVGNTIAVISADAIDDERASDAVRIDGQGRTLMPGMIDAHYHMMFATIPQMAALTSDLGFLTAVATKAASDTLMRGFTSVRDLGGPVLGLKRSIDLGYVDGPRIWPSGAFISQSGGHGDFRLPTDLPAHPCSFTHGEATGATAIADSPDEVRKRAREQLALGASQLKLMAGGGVSSAYDPLDVTQYTVPEIQAAVEAAANWGTYVTVHAYTSHAVQQALEAGVKCIDHGQMIDEETAQLMAEKGIWWSLQPFLDDEHANPFPEGSESRRKQLEMSQGTANAYELAKKYKIKTAWGSDTLFNAELAKTQGAQLAKMTRFYTPVEVLRMATSGNAELLALSGFRRPYMGDLGVVKEGALADLLLVDGNPLEDIDLVADPERNFLVIMKNGVIYKNLTE
jgi:imidazolonepropionase-like amidohydrolase